MQSPGSLWVAWDWQSCPYTVSFHLGASCVQSKSFSGRLFWLAVFSDMQLMTAAKMKHTCFVRFFSFSHLF